MALYGPVALPAQTAAGATSITVVGTVLPQDGQGSGVSGVLLTPPAAYTTVTGVATNNATFNVRQVRAAASLGVIATVTLVSGTNLVAETPLTVPITASFAVQSGDIFDVQMVQNGTGLAVNIGVLAEVAVN
jgi:hypothetical protein